MRMRIRTRLLLFNVAVIGVMATLLVVAAYWIASHQMRRETEGFLADEFHEYAHKYAASLDDLAALERDMRQHFTKVRMTYPIFCRVYDHTGRAIVEVQNASRAPPADAGLIRRALDGGELTYTLAPEAGRREFWCAAKAVQSPSGARFACERAVLKEVRRLSGILNTHDPRSEISRVNAAAGRARCSRDLLEVLQASAKWRKRSGGAFNIQLGALIATWKQAEKAGRLPDRKRLAQLVKEINRPGPELDAAAGTVRRRGAAAMNVDALAKGYVVDRAIQAAARTAGAEELLLNIGGDIRAWSRKGASKGKAWTIGVADPKRPHANSPVPVRLPLRHAAVATSGNYERYYTIGGKRYSHIFDPRTGMPAEGVLSATVVAADCASADALATILSVLKPAEGLKLVGAIAGTECLIIAAGGKRHASAGWNELASPEAKKPAPPSRWPPGYHVTFSLKLKQTWIRPYVAVWVEDATGKPVRALALWGKKEKYLKTMRSWRRCAWRNRQGVAAVTRATRSGGRYSLIWDGTDEFGKAVPPGTYVVRLELRRKKGKRYDLKGRIECGARPATGRIPNSPEVTEMKIRYGPKEKS